MTIISWVDTTFPTEMRNIGQIFYSRIDYNTETQNSIFKKNPKNMKSSK